MNEHHIASAIIFRDVPTDTSPEPTTRHPRRRHSHVRPRQHGGCVEFQQAAFPHRQGRTVPTRRSQRETRREGEGDTQVWQALSGEFGDCVLRFDTFFFLLLFLSFTPLHRVLVFVYLLISSPPLGRSVHRSSLDGCYFLIWAIIWTRRPRLLVLP